MTVFKSFYNNSEAVGWAGTLQQFIEQSTKEDSSKNKIVKALQGKIAQEFRVSKQEIDSWINSHKALAIILKESDIPRDINVICEYQIARLPYRCDVILIGKKDEQDSALIIELKQWGNNNVFSLDQNYYKGYVEVVDVGSCRHPSIQVSEYRDLFKNYYQNIKEGELWLSSCAFLHNYTFASSEIKERDVLVDGFEDYINKSPLFGGNKEEVISFLRFVKSEIEKPSITALQKLLQSNIVFNDKFLDNVQNILENKEVFKSSEEQEIVINDITEKLINNSQDNNIFIVKGGPGTGKTVVAFNLILSIKNKLKRKKIAYATRNFDMLESLKRALNMVDESDNITKNGISLLKLKTKQLKNIKTIDCLIVDEAQQLLLADKEDYLDTKMIFSLAGNVIFFMDENQKLAFRDIGYSEIIKNDAKKYYDNDKLKTLRIYDEYNLFSQFRNGSVKYLDWIKTFLGFDGFRASIFPENYDFQIVDDPNQLFKMIEDKQSDNETARVLAGCCWLYTDSHKNDIVIDSRNGEVIKKAWDYSNAIDKVCPIRKVVGQEYDYVGVIIGPDLIFENKKIVAKPDINTMFKVKRGVWRYDQLYTNKIANIYPEREDFLNAQKKGIKEQEIIDYSQSKHAQKHPEDICLVEQMIRNQYYVLLTRGRQGCFVYCVDENLQKHLRSLIARQFCREVPL